METSELEAAYRSVLDLAARAATGGPGPGSPGAGDGEAWGPDDVLAHLILNDRLLARAVRSVLDGTAQPYDNLDGDRRFVDKPLPVGSLLDIQARRHLPMHTEQLRELLERP
jgi:hypothetical protein